MRSEFYGVEIKRPIVAEGWNRGIIEGVMNFYDVEIDPPTIPLGWGPAARRVSRWYWAPGRPRPSFAFEAVAGPEPREDRNAVPGAI